jgi:alkylation response protein AidB-like acyl-CoA dehydrogenase
MDFALNDDQRMLQDAVMRLVERDYRFEQRRAHAAEPDGFSRTLWGQAAGIGLLGLAYAEADGGLGGSASDVMLVMQALGRALALDPFLPTMVLGAAAMRGATAAQRARWVPPIVAGDRVLAWAHDEAPQRGRLFDVCTQARADGTGWRLDGLKPAVLHGDSADALLVSARVEGAADDARGLALFLVDARHPGITRDAWRTHDGRRAADIQFDAVHVSEEALIGNAGAAAPLIEATLHAGIAALAAEAVGAMELALELTVEHLKTREQFGAPLARQQSLQHRAAEMLMALEQSRSMAMYAALMLDEPDAGERALALSAVKVQIDTAARFVGQQAVQLHGGIGVTEECAVGHVLKRLTLMASEFGGIEHHLVAVGRAGGFVKAAA